ncbi:putative oxidoreductase [Helianthus debilis subsp. tardiflorus]
MSVDAVLMSWRIEPITTSVPVSILPELMPVFVFMINDRCKIVYITWLFSLCTEFPLQRTSKFTSVYLKRDYVLVAIFVDEDDVAAYIIKTIDDPRTLNKTLYIRPPANILSQRQVVKIWEKLLGKILQKSSLSEKQFLDSLKGKEYVEQAAMSHFYHFFYEGCLANFEIGDDAEEACRLYPDIKYTKVEDYLKQYL